MRGVMDMALEEATMTAVMEVEVEVTTAATVEEAEVVAAAAAVTVVVVVAPGGEIAASCHVLSLCIFSAALVGWRYAMRSNVYLVASIRPAGYPVKWGGIKKLPPACNK